MRQCHHCSLFAHSIVGTIASTPRGPEYARFLDQQEPTLAQYDRTIRLSQHLHECHDTPGFLPSLSCGGGRYLCQQWQQQYERLWHQQQCRLSLCFLQCARSHGQAFPRTWTLDKGTIHRILVIHVHVIIVFVLVVVVVFDTFSAVLLQHVVTV